ncbi:NAD(P)-binding domain-containing protein [Nostoc sp. LEGE 12447]|uniref:NADPH-dependent F420 reductase n=1 Tax=unclassified Nostoc TaxID=2593658 RepID=UPI00187FB382|nr:MULTISPECIES: NAD(P)-binding domain-containing protein [unclassified Nostoc]MBE8987810.1 NAD(P)-binding domain-containing protein [Nostoc sp. LEGE 12450]MBE9001103.1 NAD(P)-binding domain-containing protein [Nostoc sp. LEGE 12447]
METIGILGTGRMGVRLACMFAEAGRDVILASRDIERSSRLVLGLKNSNLRSGSYADAAAAQFVLPAMFLRDGMLNILEPLRDQLDGKIYIDISNPFNDTYTDFILPWDTSGAEQIQNHFPKTRVVGAFKNVWWEVFDAPKFGDMVSDVFVVSDDTQAKTKLFNLTENTPFRYLDAGKLSNARTIERMTLLSGELGQRYGYFPRMNYKLLGEQWIPGEADRISSLILNS